MKLNLRYHSFKKYFGLIMLLLALTLSFNPVKAQNADDDKKKFETLLRTAEQHYRAKAYKEAKTAYKQILEIQPENRFAKDRLKAIAKVYLDPEEEASFNEAVAQGDDFLSKQMFDKAKAAYEKAKSIKPGDRDIRGKIEQVATIRSQVEELDKNYKLAIENAKNAFSNDDLQGALTYYKQAVLLKPNQSDPKNKITEIENLIKNRQETDKAYKEAIDRADSFYIERKFNQAKAVYAEAQKIKPSEAYPQSMIDKILPMLADLASKQEQYDNLVKKADQALTSKDFDSATTFYTEAGTLLPEEDYPEKQLALIAQMQADAAALQVKYDELVGEGDALFTEQKYSESRAKYSEALVLKPDEDYPKEKIGEVDAALGKIQKAEDDYNNAIAQGNALLLERKYDESKASFAKALTIKIGEEYPTTKIQEIDEILAGLAQAEESYQAEIAEADQLFALGNWSEAKVGYEKALQFKPEEAYPKERISAIENTLAAIESSYNDAIAKGDALFTERKYAESKASFENALTIKIGEEYPTSKIQEIDEILAGLAQAEESYQAAIAEADQLFTQENWTEAKVGYEKALQFKPEEAYPKERISAIENTLAAIESSYNDAIAQGDALFTERKYAESKASFENALTIKIGEEYPTSKIQEIDEILAGLAQAEESYQAAIAEADQLFTQENWTEAKVVYEKALQFKPEEAYPKERITAIENTLAAIESSYNDAIAQGDALFTERKYAESKTSFEKALTIKKGEEYPTSKIQEIAEIIAGLAQAEESYQAAIAEADQLFSQENWSEAKVGYEKALQFKPEEAYPRERITAIENTLAAIESSYNDAIAQGDALFTERKYAESKASFEKALTIKIGEEYPTSKIQEIAEIIAGLAQAEESYKTAITEGDAMMTAEDWSGAQFAYNKALQFKPDEAYPKTQLEVLEGKLAEIAAQESADKAYAEAVAQGDSFFEAEDYKQAKVSYQKALDIKFDEAYPKTRIHEVERELVKIALVDESYDNAIASADSAFNNENYNKAIQHYKEAKKIKSEESYPREQLALIQTKMSQMEAEVKAFNEALAQADKLFEDKQYQEAISAYKKAQDLNASSNYPDEQISKINQILANLAKEQEVFNGLVSKGDSLYSSYQYRLALESYKEAEQLRPDDASVKLLIEKTNQTIEEQQAKAGQYEDAIQKGDYLLGQEKLFKAKEQYELAKEIYPLESYPVERLFEIESLLRERQRQFNAYVTKGDSLYTAGMLKDAKETYESAQRLKKDDEYVKSQLKDVRRLLQDQFIKMMEEYGDAIRLADSHYKLRAFDEAIPAYELASWINPGEEYPKNRIKEIRTYMAEHEILDLVQDSVILRHDQNKRYSFNAIPASNKRNNYLVVKAARLNDDNARIFVSYGKDGRKNGGFVLKELPSGNSKEFIIRVSNHSRWISEDNNYIDFYSEGGMVKIVSVELTRGD